MSQDADSLHTATAPLAGAGSAITTPLDPLDPLGLAQAMELRLEALPANRAGQMTEEQSADVQAKVAKSAWPVLVLAGVVLVLEIVRPTIGRYGRPIVWNATTSIILLAFGIVFGLVLLINPINIWADARSKRALVMEGALTKRSPAGKSSAYLIRVNNVYFIVPQAGFDLLPDSGRCRVYYTPRSKTLLNIEAL